MAIAQILIQITYTAILLALAGLALTCYYALFYTMMIVLDGCDLCQTLQTYLNKTVRPSSGNPSPQSN